MTIIRSITALLCAAALVGCEQNAVQDITGPLPAARIRFFNFGVNSPAVNFYANDTKMTAVSTTACTPPTDPKCTTTGIEATAGVGYGGVASTGLYSGIAAGQHTFTGRIAAATDNGLAISNAAANLEAGKKYSFYQSGVYNTATKTVDAFVVEDNFPETLDYTSAQIRFVNAIHNSSPMVLFARDTANKRDYPIGAAVGYKTGGTFVSVPNGVYELYARAPGGTANLISRAGASSVSLALGRVYTITARGDMTGTVTANQPFLDNQTNR
jgi:hypothetical protein